MATTINNFCILPISMIEDLDRTFESTSMKNSAIRFIDIVMKKSWREFKDMNTMVEIPSNYFRKVFNGHYKEWLDLLISSKIILINNSYYNKEYSYSKSYSLNGRYFLPSTIMLPRLKETDYKSISYVFKKKVFSEVENNLKKRVTEDFKKLKIDTESLLKIMYMEMDKIRPENFKKDFEIEDLPIELSIIEEGKEKTVWLKRDSAIAYATQSKSSLIKDGKKFYTMRIADFCEMKKNAIYIAYKESIMKMDKGMYFAKRNSTNNRLDSNFTNMAGVLSKDICKKNNLVQFDLANAQFAILSDIFTKDLKTVDFELFKMHSTKGTLYEYIMEHLKTDDRKSAKLLAFELLFSKETNNTAKKRELKKLFPSVVEKVDLFKKENGYKNFSIMLQKKESEIFIDGLWEELKKKKIFCITKHDCLIVREEDKEKVKVLIENYFRKINFSGKITEE